MFLRCSQYCSLDDFYWWKVTSGYMCCYSMKPSVKNSSSWPLKTGAIGCPKKLVQNYHSQNSEDLAKNMSWKPRFHQSTVFNKATLIIVRVMMTYSSKNLHLFYLYLFPLHHVLICSTIHLQHLPQTGGRGRWWAFKSQWRKMSHMQTFFVWRFLSSLPNHSYLTTPNILITMSNWILFSRLSLCLSGGSFPCGEKFCVNFILLLCMLQPSWPLNL